MTKAPTEEPTGRKWSSMTEFMFDLQAKDDRAQYVRDALKIGTNTWPDTMVTPLLQESAVYSADQLYEPGVNTISDFRAFTRRSDVQDSETGEIREVDWLCYRFALTDTATGKSHDYGNFIASSQI